MPPKGRAKFRHACTAEGDDLDTIPFSAAAISASIRQQKIEGTLAS
ncbi:MAG: hypothetical protein HC868_08635 [Sphingomonadales bacterium]|nr:hypothetical protein [Sphingomonadales bacterium]